METRGRRGRRAAALWALWALGACGETGGGGGAGTADDGGMGEQVVPRAGVYRSGPVNFRLTDDARLVELDLDLSCVCDRHEATLVGRVDGGAVLEDDGFTVKPVVNRAARLRIAGAFTDETHFTGVYDYQCCTGIAWEAAWVDASQTAPPGACTGAPAGTDIPVGTTDSGATLHWAAPHTCIGLTLAPSLESVRARIQRAADAWTGVECSPVCFGELGAADAPPEGADDRRIHVQVPDEHFSVPSGTQAQTHVLVRQGTGEITGAVVVLGDAAVAADTDAEYLRQLGRALGFDHAPEEIDSVLAPGGRHSALTSADAEALCALYGDVPFCAE